MLDTSIELSSRRGRGSVFRITLPSAAAPEGSTVVQGPQTDLVQGLRLLVLDDETSVREGLGLLLRRRGVAVRPAATLAEALVAIHVDPGFGVALCDYRLAEQATGFDAIAAPVAAQAQPLAVCLITGDLDPQLLAKAQRNGVHLAHKPLHPARLRALLNHLATDRSRCVVAQ